MNPPLEKKILVVILALILSACDAMPDMMALLATVTPTSEKVSTEPPFPIETPTLTPTQPTPTFTSTPTIVGAGSTITIPTMTLTPFVPTFDVVEPRPLTLLSGDSMFISISASTDTIVWGSHCEGPRTIDFSTGVAGINVDYVLLFLHLEDKFTGYGTHWGAGAIMQREKVTGKYLYHVTYEQLPNYRDFEDAWIVFQIVAATDKLERLGATRVYDREISLKHCPVPWQE
jgi:hypothetical protein